MAGRNCSSATVAEGCGAGFSRGRLVLILTGVTLGVLFAALGQTVIGTALPRVAADLGGLQHYAWVFTGYMLASTVTVPIYGKLSDVYGRRPCFLLGMTLFLCGSALSGLSQDMTQLIVFRAIQGLGAGGTMPIAQAIIGDIFPPAERGKWQGLLMAVFGLAAVVGPTGGGWITDNWGWRWVFYVNMPVGIVAILTAGLVLPAEGGRRRRQIDYLGATLLVAAAVSLLLALSWAGSEYPWASAQTVGLLACALAIGAAFVIVEMRAAEPIINPMLFRTSTFTVSVVATFLGSAGMYGAIMYLPLFVQGVIGESATNAGAVLTPMMLGFVGGSAIGGQIISRTGRYRRLALAGFVVAATGMFLLSRMDAATSSWLVVRNMMITGSGVGVGMSLFVIVVQNAFPSGRLGQVTASVQFFRSVGGTVGVALLGTVMASRFQADLAVRMPAGLGRALPTGMAVLGDPQALFNRATAAALEKRFALLGPEGGALFARLLAAARSSLASAIADVFAVGCVLMLSGLFVTLFLRELPRGKGRPPASGEPGVVDEEEEGLAADAAWATPGSGVAMPAGGCRAKGRPQQR